MISLVSDELPLGTGSAFQKSLTIDQVVTRAINSVTNLVALEFLNSIGNIVNLKRFLKTPGRKMMKK